MPSYQGSAPEPAAGSRRPAIDAAQISFAVPRRMQQGRPNTLEVRIERPPLATASGGARSYALRPEVAVARAIAVRLRPAGARFVVDAASPETQWDQPAAASGGRLATEAAVWRFTVTPLEAGRGVLQLAVSARTLAADGVLAETQIPEQSHEVRIVPQYGRRVARLSAWLGAAVLGMVALKLVEGLVGIDVFFLVKQLLR
ncbi:MAG: hypothetical protein AB7O57_16605 [Hyphomicrobiaceae bacterium]